MNLTVKVLGLTQEEISTHSWWVHWCPSIDVLNGANE